MTSDSILPGSLNRFKNDVFIETGTHLGGGVATALDAGFKKIISIEIHKPYHDLCRSKFSNNKNVKLHLGDTEELLPAILDEIQKPIGVTLFLDAHIDMQTGARGVDRIPLVKELNIIRDWKRNKKAGCPTILIDDVRQFNTALWENIGKNAIIEALLEIGPYNIKYMDNRHAPNDILIAKIQPG